MVITIFSDGSTCHNLTLPSVTPASFATFYLRVDWSQFSGVWCCKNTKQWQMTGQLSAHEMDSQFSLLPLVPSSKLKGNVVVIQWKWKSWWWPCSQLFQHPPPGPSYELLHGLLSKQQRVTNIQHHGEDVQITGPPSGWADTRGANEISRKF